VRALSDEDQRLPHLLELIGQPAAPTAEEKEQAREHGELEGRSGLGRLLLVTRLLAPSPTVVRTILTARPNRSLRDSLILRQPTRRSVQVTRQDCEPRWATLPGTICTRLSAPCLTRFG